MPRTSAVGCLGPPRIRVLSFDVRGLIQVIDGREAVGVGVRANTIIPEVVQTWGESRSSKAVLAASINDRKFNPLLAVARENGSIEVLNPRNGEVLAVDNEVTGLDAYFFGLHLFRKEELSSSRSCKLLTCTLGGKAVIRSLDFASSHADSNSTDPPKMWNVCDAGKILCSEVHGSEKYALFGGRGVELNMWDLETCSCTWITKTHRIKSPDKLDPTWFTASRFVSKEDHRKIVSGTGCHQVRVFDVSAQRTPVMSVVLESAIRTVTEDPDGNTIYVGTADGHLTSLDIRSGKIQNYFLRKLSGTIRSIVRLPKYPVIATCALDGCLRFWDINERILMSEVIMEEFVTKVVVDSNFSDIETTAAAAAGPSPNIEDDGSTLVKRKKRSTESKKLKPKKKKEKQVQHEDEDDEEKQTLVEEDEDDSAMTVKREKASRGGSEQCKKLNRKKKKEKRAQQEDEDDEKQMLVEEDDDDASMPLKSKKASREETTAATPVKWKKRSRESKKINSKKEKQVQHEDEDDEEKQTLVEEEDDSAIPMKRKKTSCSEQSKKLKREKKRA